MAFLSGWTPRERHAVIAAYLGWSLDAFDFFVLVFVLPDIATSFGVTIPDVALALTLTLAFRPLGAFHHLADGTVHGVDGVTGFRLNGFHQ